MLTKRLHLPVNTKAAPLPAIARLGRRRVFYPPTIPEGKKAGFFFAKIPFRITADFMSKPSVALIGLWRVKRRRVNQQQIAINRKDKPQTRCKVRPAALLFYFLLSLFTKQSPKAFWHILSFFKKQLMRTTLTSLLTLLFSSLSLFLAAQAPTLLRNINTAEGSSTPKSLVKSNSLVYFNADDGIHGRELWKSDGTEAGTEMVKDITSGEDDSTPENFCSVNGTVFFTATTPQYGAELWKTDGTPTGTVIVKDLIAGQVGSEPQNLISCNGKLFFTINMSPGLAEDIRLFVSDGTAIGTVEIRAPNPGLFGPRNLLGAGNTLFFTARYGSAGEELWQTDGTENGTKMVRDLNPNALSSSFPKNLCTDGLYLYFSADDGSVHGRQIWKYNLNANTMLRQTSIQLQNGNNFGQIVWHPNNVVFFTAASLVPGPGYELYRLNSAAPNGATKIGGTSNVGNLKVLGQKLCFTQALAAGPKLSYVLTNSNISVTLKTFALIPNADSPMPQGLTVANSKLFFTAATAANGRELWKTNGTAAGTMIVADYMLGTAGSDISNLCNYTNKLMFGCKGADGNELRMTDGTVITTVRNIRQANSNPTGFVKMDNTTYFAAEVNSFGRELWKTDGTNAGTVIAADIVVGQKSSSPSDFLVVTASNGAKTLFFVAEATGFGRELFKLENTPNAIPVRISDIIPVTEGSSNIGNLTNVNGTLHFTATNIALVSGDRIYKVNTARSGVEITGGTILFADNLVAKGSTLFFTQKSLGDEPMLCKLVVGANSTIMTFIPNDVFNVSPRNLTVVGNYLYFSAGDALHGRELWRTNAAATSATRISDIRPGVNSSNPANLTNFNGVLHFTAITDLPNLGPQIYKTNAGLTGVLPTGGPVSWAFDLEAAGNHLFFFQTVPDQTSVKLCKLINGIATPIKSFGPVQGELPLSKLGMTAAGSNVYFGAYTAENGIELWKSNGTEIGTVLTGDIRPGAIGANFLDIRLAGSDLYFSAHNLAYAQEPWKIANATALQEPGEGEDRDEMTATVLLSDFKISPNPASDFVQVLLPENNISGLLSIVSASGQILRLVQVSEGEWSAQMNVQDLPRGWYMLRFAQADGEVLVQKVVLQ